MFGLSEYNISAASMLLSNMIGSFVCVYDADVISEKILSDEDNLVGIKGRP